MLQVFGISNKYNEISGFCAPPAGEVFNTLSKTAPPNGGTAPKPSFSDSPYKKYAYFC